MLLSKRRNRIAATVVGTLLLITVTSLIYHYFNYQYQVMVAGERDRLTVTADYLDRRFNTCLVGLSLLAAHSDVRSLDPKRVRPNLLAAARALDAVSVALYDYNGRLIVDGGSVPDQAGALFGQSYYTRDFRSLLTGSSKVSERIMLGNSLQNAYVSMQVPVIDDGQVTAVVAAYIPISDISLTVQRENVSETRYTLVLDGDGQFIHHPRLSEIFPESPLLKQQLKELFVHRKGASEINSPLDGIDKLVIYTDLHNNVHWRIATVIPLNVLHTRILCKALEDAESFLLLAVCLGLLFGVWHQARYHERERGQLRLERMMCVNQLAAGIAHEIRNPLTSIKGFIQLMARHSDKPVSLAHLEIIISEIGRIENLVSEFQMLARPLKEHPLLERVNICKLLSDVRLLMEVQFYNKNIVFDLQLPAAGWFTLGDKSQLKQVFINLVKNALEAAPVGGNVAIKVTRQQGMMAVAVENDGDNIPPEIIEKLGTPFFTTKANGTGLGLSVCYSIIEGHGGKIQISSSAGKRTVFTVMLPIAEDEGLSLNK